MTLSHSSSSSSGSSSLALSSTVPLNPASVPGQAPALGPTHALLLVPQDLAGSPVVVVVAAEARNPTTMMPRLHTPSTPRPAQPGQQTRWNGDPGSGVAPL